jgi:hypothetical protein
VAEADGERAVRAGGRDEDLEVDIPVERPELAPRLFGQPCPPPRDVDDRFDQAGIFITRRDAVEAYAVVQALGAEQRQGRDLVDPQGPGVVRLGPIIVDLEAELVGQGLAWVASRTSGFSSSINISWASDSRPILSLRRRKFKKFLGPGGRFDLWAGGW